MKTISPLVLRAEALLLTLMLLALPSMATDISVLDLTDYDDSTANYDLRLLNNVTEPFFGSAGMTNTAGTGSFALTGGTSDRTLLTLSADTNARFAGINYFNTVSLEHLAFDGNGNTISRNLQNVYGGLLAVQAQKGNDSALHITDSTFQNAEVVQNVQPNYGPPTDKAGAGGGGLYVGQDGGNITETLTLDKVDFLANKLTQNLDVSIDPSAAPGEYSALGGGACLYLGDGGLTITDANVKNNSVATNGGVASGGGIYISGEYGAGGVTITGSTFDRNTAENTWNNAAAAAMGGALSLDDVQGTIVITDTNFTNNSAVTKNGIAAGGAIFTNVSLTIKAKEDNVEFSGNFISKNGVETSNAINLAGAGVIVTFDAATGRTITDKDGIEGSGGITKTGGGILILAAENDYRYGGETVIEEGTVEITNANLITAGSLKMESGTTLDAHDNNIELNGAIDGEGDIYAHNVFTKKAIEANIITATGNVEAKDGNITAKKIDAASGNVTASGDITVTTDMKAIDVTAGGDINVDNTITATGNVEAKNITAKKIDAASGNVTASGNITVTTDMTAIDVTAGGDIKVDNTITVTGNVEAKNITAKKIDAASGNVTASGDITATNLKSGGTIKGQEIDILNIDAKNIEVDTLLQVSNGNISGSVSGPGGIKKIGGDTLTLEKADKAINIEGTLTVEGGVLQVTAQKGKTAVSASDIAISGGTIEFLTNEGTGKYENVIKVDDASKAEKLLKDLTYKDNTTALAYTAKSEGSGNISLLATPFTPKNPKMDLVSNLQRLSLWNPHFRVFNRLYGEVDGFMPRGTVYRGQNGCDPCERVRHCNDGNPLNQDGLWFDVYNRYEQVSGDNHSGAFRTNRWGIMAGKEYRITPSAIVGALFGYGQPRVQNSAGLIEADDLTFAGYANFSIGGNLHGNVFAGYGYQDYESQLSGSGRSHFHGNTLHTSVEMYQPLRLQNGLKVFPLVAFDYQQNWMNDGTIASMPVRGQGLEQGNVRIGMNTRLDTQEGINFHSRLQYSYLVVGDPTGAVGTTYAGSWRTHHGVNISRSNLNAGLGTDFNWGSGQKVFVDYDFDLGHKLQAHTAQVGFSTAW